MRTFSVVSIPLLSELSWCEHSSAVRIFLVSAFLRCQNFPGVSISSAVRICLVSVFLRCQDFPGVSIFSVLRIFLVSAFLCRQHSSGMMIFIIGIFLGKHSPSISIYLMSGFSWCHHFLFKLNDLTDLWFLYK
jgi:hypothetical protein